MDWGVFTNIVEYYKTAVGEGINVMMFIQTVGMLIFYFIIRYIIYLKIENIPLFSKNISKSEHAKKNYLFGHITLELILAFAIAYSLLVLRGSQTHNYIWNMIVAPGVGMFVSILIDLKVIMKNEENSPILLSLGTYGGKKNKSSSSPSFAPANHLAPSINVQVNTGDGSIESNTKNNSEPLNDNVKVPEHIKLSNNEDELRSNVINAINGLIDVQSTNKASIDLMNEKIETIDTKLENLHKLEKRRYQISLKNKIYACLDKGFATPRENEEIEVDYYNYTKILGEGGEIKTLHDDRYLKLGVHEDRRISQEIYIGEDRRNKSYVYK